MASSFLCLCVTAFLLGIHHASGASNCETIKAAICSQHIHHNTTYCASNGRHYPSACAFWTASCQHKINVTGIGPHCNSTSSHHITHHPRTTTILPLTPFERALYKSIVHGIDDRLLTTQLRHIPVATAKLIYTKQDHKNKAYVRNTDCWAYGLDLTCMSPWNSQHGIRKAGTLISPRHAVWARHYNIPVNTTIRFVDVNNDVVDRRITALRWVSPKQHSFWGHDIVVGVLDRDVPSTIGFARVLPRNLTTFRTHGGQTLPTFSSDFEEKALIDDFSFISGQSAGLRVPSKTSLRYQYYESKIVGDSGNPTFFVINNEVVLLFVFTTGGAGGGSSVVHYYDEINDIMAKLGGGYKLTDVNLNSFLAPGQHVPLIIGK